MSNAILPMLSYGPSGTPSPPFQVQFFSGPSSAPSQYTSLPSDPSGFGFGGVPVGAWDDWGPGFAPLLNAFIPDPSSIKGSQCLVCSYASGPIGSSPDSNSFYLVIEGIHPQNLFNSITIGAPVNETFLSSAAVLFTNTTWAAENFTFWGWNTNTSIFGIGVANVSVT